MALPRRCLRHAAIQLIAATVAHLKVLSPVKTLAADAVFSRWNFGLKPDALAGPAAGVDPGGNGGAPSSHKWMAERLEAFGRACLLLRGWGMSGENSAANIWPCMPRLCTAKALAGAGGRHRCHQACSAGCPAACPQCLAARQHACRAPWRQRQSVVAHRRRFGIP
jgi:hypothetical protein